MYKLRNKLVAIAALGILAAVGALMNSRQAAAQGPPDGLAVRRGSPHCLDRKTDLLRWIAARLFRLYCFVLFFRY